MTPDERRVVHNTLNGMAHIKTESSGEGLNRAVTVKYIPGPNETKPTSVSKSAPTKPVVEQPAEEKPAETEPAAEEKPVEETEAPKTGE